MSSTPQLDDFLAKLESIITKKYEQHIIQSGKLLCKASSNREIGSIGKIVFHPNPHMLKEAYDEIAKDIRFLFERRGARIGPERPSPGKIAGVMVYRLSRSHIINIYEGCASCEYQCASKLDYYFAVRCAWEYINIPYQRVPQEIRRELLYSLALRHVNQETLALVFDTILHYHTHPHI
jgi:hypothetical protein